MADYVERYSDAQAEAYARKIKRTYEQAAKEVKKKLEDFQLKHKAKSAKMLKDVADGKITKSDYQKWLKGQVFQSNQWEQKLKDITKVYVEADEKARELLGGTTKNVFVEAANHTAYDIEKDFRGGVAFNVYDRKTVDRLMRDNPKMLPEWKINEKKDYIWNEERVQNAVTQGIIQGEGIADIGKRLTSELAASNASKMNMFARTAITGSQNAGRIERLHEAEKMGIKVKKRWMATLDDRTRDAHQELDGQVVDVDEPFHCSLGNIMFPGDPSADPANVYNCRCTMVYVYPDFEQSFERIASLGRDEDGRKQYETIKDTTYKKWKESKGKSSYEVKRIEYGNLFPAEAPEITRQTIHQLQTEFPLTFDLDYVGDVRTHRSIGIDEDIFDLHYNHKELTPCTAQYLTNGVGDGKPCIEIHKENCGTGSLKDEFQMRYELRKRQGIDITTVPEKKHAFYAVADSLEGTIMHEYGHALSDSYGVFTSGRENPYKDWEWRFWELHKEELPALSLYAASHPDEMFAEAFVQYHDKEHTDTLAYKLASEIIETFIRYIKGGEI